MSICWVGLSALASGWVGTVLVGGPVGIGAPTLAPVTTGSLLTAIVVLLARRLPPAARLAFATVNLLATLPLIGIVAAMYASGDLVHLTTQTSALGWVLVAVLPLAATIAARRVGGSDTGVDIAFGGLVGLSGAALIQVAVSAASDSSPLWALAGWALGAAVISGVGRLPPQPALRTPLGPTWRTLPFVAAWVMAIITAVPAAPRHELSTSAGAQVLAVTVATGLLVASLAFWWAEGNSTAQRPWVVFRLAMRQFAPSIATLTLFLVGGLQAASYSEVTIDDLAQFWLVADRLANHEEYPIWGSRASLPGLPILLLLAFSAFGRTYPAALAPMFLANALLPWLIYRAALAAGAGRSAAFVIAVLAVVLPVVQVYSLGSAEPDPVFIAVLAGAVWMFARVLRTSGPRYSLLALGGLAGALVVTRPEGPLYGGLLLLAGLAATRSRWAIAGSLFAGAIGAPLVVFSLIQLGRPWPTFGPELSLATVAENAKIVGGVTLPKIARIVLLNDFRFAMLLAAILTLVVIGSVHVARRRLEFIILPVAVVANVAVKLSISSYMVRLRPDFPPEFVRHIAYPTPIVAVLGAVGITVLAGLAAKCGSRARATSQVVGIAAAVYLVAGSLYILGTPEEFHHGNQSGSLLAANIYVNAPELWMNPFDLPSGEWDFIDYRSRLFAWYEPFDNHSDTAGMAYQTLTGAVAALGFAALLAAAPQRKLSVPRNDRR